jgi:myo-inositol 2-dehydrogenase / D-chiro-inositol 1-dehydrogenase
MLPSAVSDDQGRSARQNEDHGKGSVTVRIGIIGAGIMGADHALTVSRSVRGAEVSVVADVDLARAAACADQVGARAGGDPAAVITDAQVDAVVIASPDPTHPDLLRRCAAADKPVLCEKPLAPAFGEATSIAGELADRAELISLGFMRRFDPGYVDLKVAIGAGAYGRPLLVRSTGRGVASAPGATSESSVTNSAIHDLDVVPWLLDAPIMEASWQTTSASGAAPDFADPQVILLRTADGVLAVIDIFLNARYGYDVRCEVVCESAALQLTEPATLSVDAELRRSTAYAADWRLRFAAAYRLELQAWIDSIAFGGSRGALATLHDGWQASAVAQAVITSMHSDGTWIGVPGWDTAPEK